MQLLEGEENNFKIIRLVDLMMVEQLLSAN